MTKENRTPDEMAAAILLSPGPQADKDVALAELSLRVTEAATLTMPCPACGARAPKEDNGQTGVHLALLCTACGEQWEPND